MRPRRYLRPAAMLVAMLGLAACGAPTPYQPAAGGYGFSEQALEADRYRVTFSGNSLTSRQTVENYLLARAAQVTLQRGYDHFVVVDRGTDRQTTYTTTVTDPFYDPFYDPFRRDLFWRPYPHGWNRTATAWPEDSFTAHANIVLREGPKPAGDANAYDARAVWQSLAPTLRRESQAGM